MSKQEEMSVGKSYQWLKKELLYEGKAKKIFNCEFAQNNSEDESNLNKNQNDSSPFSMSDWRNVCSALGIDQEDELKSDKLLWVEYKNSLTAFNALKKGAFSNKGLVNHNISGLIYRYLTARKIKTHLVQDFEHNNTAVSIVKKLEMIPLEIVVRNYVAGSLSKKMGIPEGQELKRPLVEFYFKSDSLADPFLSEEQILVLGLVSQDVLNRCKTLALNVNQGLQELMLLAGIKLIDFKIEAGFMKDLDHVSSLDEVILADEISPDCMRLWDLSTNKKMDKDRFRQDLGQVEEVYNEVLQRLQKVVV